MTCCGDPADCDNAQCRQLDIYECIAAATLDQPYFDSNGNEGTIDEVNAP